MVVEGKICLTEKNVNEMKKKKKKEKEVFARERGGGERGNLTRTLVHVSDLGHVPFREV